MARRLRYQVAMSLDGYIAAEDGGYDWIVMDPELDGEVFAMFAEFDARIMGRGTYELVQSLGGEHGMGDMATYVASTTLDPAEHPGVTVVSDDVEAFVAELKAGEGKDIWLFGGGVLFRSLLEAGLVDTVEVAVMPVLLGAGVPLLPGFEGTAPLRLRSVRSYETSGTLMLAYDVAAASG